MRPLRGRRRGQRRDHREQRRHRRACAARRRRATAATRWSACRRAPIASMQVRAARRETVTLSVASTATLDLEPARRRRDSAHDARRRHRCTGHRWPDVKTSEVGATVSQHRSSTCRRSRATSSSSPTPFPACVFRSIPATARPSAAAARRTASGINLYIDGVGQKSYVRTAASAARCHAGQSVPAARHRRIQGHHVELQGRIRPDLERRHHRGDPVGHQ